MTGKRITLAQLNILRSIDQQGPAMGDPDGKTIRWGGAWNVVLACETRGWLRFDPASLQWGLTEAGRAKLADCADMVPGQVAWR